MTIRNPRGAFIQTFGANPKWPIFPSHGSVRGLGADPVDTNYSGTGDSFDNSNDPSMLSKAFDFIFDPYSLGYNMFGGSSGSSGIASNPLGLNTAVNTVANGISSSIKTGTTLLVLAGIAYLFLSHPPGRKTSR